MNYVGLLCDENNLAFIMFRKIDYLTSSCRVYRMLQPITISYPAIRLSSDEFVNAFNEK